MPLSSRRQGESLLLCCAQSNNLNGRSLRETDASGDNYGHVDVAVPSRLRRHVSSKLPLSSIRVAVKDNFDLEGTKTSLCSKSYLQTYPEKSQSAPCIQQILDLGASIIGKTKLCAFAQSEEPTEAIEYTSPWSARADGFQSSGGSSNGSGAAISAYDWLDITIGSDSKIHLACAFGIGIFTPFSNWKHTKTCTVEWLLCPATYFRSPFDGGICQLHQVRMISSFLLYCTHLDIGILTLRASWVVTYNSAAILPPYGMVIV